MIRRLVLVLVGLARVAWAQNVSTSRFLSRPDIAAPILTVNTIDYAAVSPGYIFLAPKNQTPHDFTPGMYIYNNGGGLVWSGHGLNVADHALWTFQPCAYLGAPHLCAVIFRGTRAADQSTSHGLIVDNSYHKRQSIAPSAVYGNRQLETDFHEFHTVGDGSTALMTSYSSQYLVSNISTCPGSPVVPFVKSGHFIEVKTDGTNQTIFQWNSLDHVGIDETVVCPGSPQVGTGTSLRHGFDYFHINSVDKNADGDYLISARFTSTIYKIAGVQSPSGLPPGEIIWRLGGKQSSFDLKTQIVGGGDFNFSFQHDARFSDHGSITFWDNAMKERGEASAIASAGKHVDIDEPARTATLIWQGSAPSYDLDESQGNHQVLANGNHFCGMGSTPEIFERTSGGAVGFAASFGAMPMQSYRAFHLPWTGRPTNSEMALFSFARNCSGPTTLYASWNGATEVRQYRFMGSNASTGMFQELLTATTGDAFETTAQSPTFARYTYAEAIGDGGTRLGRTVTVRTFVPAATLAERCADDTCGYNVNYDMEDQALCFIEDRYDGW